MKFVPIGELVYRVYVSVDNRSVDSDLIIVDVRRLGNNDLGVRGLHRNRY